MNFYLNLNEEIKPLLLSEIRIRSHSLPDQQWASIDNKFYPLVAILFDYEEKKSKEEEVAKRKIADDKMQELMQLRSAELKAKYSERISNISGVK